jgi:hypothetical protein
MNKDQSSLKKGQEKCHAQGVPMMRIFVRAVSSAR